MSCLGGDPTWTVDHDTALNWAFRATADAMFDGVHLDVGPWALPRWPEDARMLMTSYATLVEEMTEVAPLAVDIVPWVVDSHPRRSATLCVSAIRSLRWPTATGPRASSPTFAGLRSCVWRRAAVPNRRGDTAAVVIDTEQHDIRRRRRGCAAPGARRGRHTNRRAPVRRVRSSPPRLLADDAPVTAYSRPADTQFMSWKRFPDTAVAAASSAAS